MQSIEQKAEKAYNAYNETSEKPWLSWDGKPVPRWHELPATEAGRIVQRKWIASTMAVLEGEPGVAVQAKVKINHHQVTEYEYGKSTTVHAFPVNDPANAAWAAASPGGKLELTVANPEALKQLGVGKTFLLDFRPVEG